MGWKMVAMVDGKLLSWLHANFGCHAGMQKSFGMVEKDVEKSQRAKAFLDRELATIKPGVESHLQLFIVLYIFVTSPKCFGATQAISFTTLNIYYKLFKVSIKFANS